MVEETQENAATKRPETKEDFARIDLMIKLSRHINHLCSKHLMGHQFVLNLNSLFVETEVSNRPDLFLDEVYQIHLVDPEILTMEHVVLDLDLSETWNEFGGFLVSTYIENDTRQSSIALPLTLKEYESFKELKKLIGGRQYTRLLKDGEYTYTKIWLTDKDIKAYHLRLQELAETINNISPKLLSAKLIETLPKINFFEGSIAFPKILDTESINTLLRRKKQKSKTAKK